MISSDEGDEIGISDFIGKKKQEGFDAIETSIDEISQEEIANFGHISTIFEEFQEIIELSMDISTNSDRWIDSLHIALLNQYFPSLSTQMFDFLLAYDFSFSKHLYLFI